jgi:L-ascorbate metabolism protein UlaG (beta-lactamase superfamily)
MIKIRLIRNATLLITMGDYRFLVDPMLAEKDAYDPIRWTSNNIRNPMTDLPVSSAALKEIIAGIDAVIITHTHNDHWDETARALIPKDKLLIGQPEDLDKFREQGFTNTVGVDREYHYEGIRFTRTGGQHGTGEIGAMMAPVSGFILQQGDESLYIAGDTIWCAEVEEAIGKFQPEIIVLNTGAAQFDKGDPITMTMEDVLAVCRKSRAKKIISVHLEAINHCHLRRDALRNAVAKAGESGRCFIPLDGETI